MQTVFDWENAGQEYLHSSISLLFKILHYETALFQAWMQHMRINFKM